MSLTLKGVSGPPISVNLETTVMHWWVRLPVFLLLTAFTGGGATAADWPQWRGPNRDGVQPAFAIPGKWPTTLKQLWSVNVGAGHSGPVVAGARVYVFSRQAEEEVVRCLDLKNGKEQWASRYAAPYEMNSAARGHGKGPKSTPAVGAGAVVTLGINGILSCWDAASGKQRWQKEFGKRFKTTAPLYGTATSPLIDGERCIAFVGGHDKGALCSFEMQTGALAWSWEGDGPGYASPILVERGGTRQLITQSQTLTVGLDVETGKLLWQVPFTTDYDQNIVTPIAFGDKLILSGVDHGTTALGIAAGERWQARQVWHNKEVSFYMSTPVRVGGRLFALSHKRRGELVALDAATGKLLWTGPNRLGDNASLVAAGNTLLVSTTGSELLAVNAAADSYELLARYKLASTPTWAHIAVLEDRLLVKDAETVSLWAVGH